MSLIKKYFTINFTYKTISAFGHLLKDTRINCAQYYTCINNSGNVQSTIFNCQRLGESTGKDISIMAFIKENNLTEKAKNAVKDLRMVLPSTTEKHKHLGYLWFRTLDEINAQEFLRTFKMEDSFYSWFQVIELHVWMLLCHLPKEGRMNRIIRLGVVQAMWEDSEKRARMLAEFNKNFRKNFHSLYGEYMFSQVYYDFCINKDDVILSSAVWVNFFNKQYVDPRLIEALVSYIRYQMHHLSKLNIEELHEREEKSGIWAPMIPHVQKLLGNS